MRIDPYVIDVLMPDLVGHDKQPSAFILYLYLCSEASKKRGRTVQLSHQHMANETGLSKSAVQAAVRNLVRRKLLASRLASRTAVPEYSVLRPWRRNGFRGGAV